jgi:penicillin-binding protein-related factor A (putative recombinase)
VKERDFQTKFSKWLKYNHEGSAAFELKITKTDSLPFSSLAEHQKESLLHVKHSRLVYKIPDDSRGSKPFDCFKMSNCPAFVVVYFYTHGEKQFYIIDIDKWVQEEETSKRKSLTRERAEHIGLVRELNALC